MSHSIKSLSDETRELLKYSGEVLEEAQRRQRGDVLLQEIPQGSGSGLDADMVDGLHLEEIIARLRRLVSGGGGGGQGPPGPPGPQGPQGESFGILDGGSPESTYGGIIPISGGTV